MPRQLNMVIDWDLTSLYSSKYNMQLVNYVQSHITVINNSPFVQSDKIRVGFNIFGEFSRFGPFPLFYTDD